MNLESIPCPACGATAKEVIFAEGNVRVGWYCPCGHFEKAVGRERLITVRNES